MRGICPPPPLIQPFYTFLKAKLISTLLPFVLVIKVKCCKFKLIFLKRNPLLHPPVSWPYFCFPETYLKLTCLPTLHTKQIKHDIFCQNSFLFVCLSVCLSVHHPVVHLSVCLSFHPTVNLLVRLLVFCLYMCYSVKCLSVCPSIQPSICSSIYQ